MKDNNDHMTAAQYQEYLNQKGHQRGKQISQAEINYENLYIIPRHNSGEIESYEKQVEFELYPKTATEKRIVFTPDFVIEYADGRKVVVELKGQVIKKLQRDYHLRVRQFKELYPEYEYVEEKSEDWTR